MINNWYAVDKKVVFTLRCGVANALIEQRALAVGSASRSYTIKLTHHAYTNRNDIIQARNQRRKRVVHNVFAFGIAFR